MRGMSRFRLAGVASIPIAAWLALGSCATPSPSAQPTPSPAPILGPSSEAATPTDALRLIVADAVVPIDLREVEARDRRPGHVGVGLSAHHVRRAAGSCAASGSLVTYGPPATTGLPRFAKRSSASRWGSSWASPAAAFWSRS